MNERVKVVVTGAAGQIAYSLIPRLVDGKTFGNKKVDLCLVEIPQVVDKLEGLVMELEDSYFPHMGEVTYTDDFEKASMQADWFLLVGSIPRGIVYEGKKIEERSDLLKINGGIFVKQGEPNDDYTIDPMGTISIIDLNDDSVTTLDFSSFNSQEASLETQGFRVFGPNADLAKDVEPEYIAVSDDSQTAWVSLQENNGIAKINLTTKTIEAIYPLGYKDHSLPQNSLDASNEDGVKLILAIPLFSCKDTQAV